MKQKLPAFDYTYDELSRRSQRIDSGAVTNEFGYNDRNELTTALMPALSGVDGETNGYSYAYDNIGNCVTASTPLTSSTYAANELNQYTSNRQQGAKTTGTIYEKH